MLPVLSSLIKVRRPFELPATIESPDGLTVEGASAQLLTELLAELGGAPPPLVPSAG